MNATRTLAVTHASLRMFVRDRAALFFTFAFPIMFMLIFGSLFGDSSSRPTLDVVGQGPLVTALRQSGAVKLKQQPSVSEALHRVTNGDVAAALIVSGNSVKLRYSASATTESPVIRSIVSGVADELNLRAAGAARTVRVQATQVEADSLRYVDLLTPGLLAMAIAQSATFGVAFSLVAWRQKGMLRRLRLTPLPLAEFAAGRVLFHLGIALVQAVFLLGVGMLVYGVTIVGSVFALVPIVLLGVTPFVALGVAIGGRANSEDATAAISNMIVLPMTFLGGVFFPVDQMPALLRSVAAFLPLTYLARSLQDVAVRGHSFTSTLPNLGVLALAAAVLTVVSLKLFRWQTAS